MRVSELDTVNAFRYKVISLKITKHIYLVFHQSMAFTINGISKHVTTGTLNVFACLCMHMYTSSKGKDGRSMFFASM